MFTIISIRKLVLVISLVYFSQINYAQESNAPGLLFNHMALSVKDLNRSVGFYKDILSLHEIPNNSGLEGIRWISLGEGKELHLISFLKEPVVINKAVHLALATDNMDALIRRLDEHKIIYSDFAGKPKTVNKRGDGIKQVYFQDPDGYWIEVNNVNEDLPARFINEKQVIHNLLDSFNRAAAKADYKNYFDFYADDAIFTGTDATERWDKNSFMAWAKPIFDRGRAWNFTALERHIYFDKTGNTAWFDELLNTQMKICRGSGVLIKQDDGWKLAQYILSATIPNDEMDSVIKLKAAQEDPLIKKLQSK